MIMEIKEKPEEVYNIGSGYLNIFFSSGSNDALPIGKDERRYFILEEKKDKKK